MLRAPTVAAFPSALLLAWVPASAAGFLMVYPGAFAEGGAGATFVHHGLSMVCLGGGAALGRRRPELGRALGLIGLLGIASLLALGLVEAPAAGFWVVLAATLSALRLTVPLPPPQARGTQAPLPAAREAALLAAVAWVAGVLVDGPPRGATLAAVLATALVPSALLLAHARRRARAGERAWHLGLGAVAPWLGLSVWAWSPALAYLLLAGAPLAPWVAAAPRPPGVRAGAWVDLLIDNPARLLVATFAALSLGGAALLRLPLASTRAPASFIDALFTAVSACCVTGLGVLDTPTFFTPFGQAVILLLIQVGGLGIMTFSTAAVVLFGGRLSVRHEGAVLGLVGAERRDRLREDLKRVLVVTFGVEAAGALLLTGAFVARGEALGTALWRGVFTAVSAFCNAGFALQSDNLVSYNDSPFILHTVALLIVAGGLGPAVVVALPAVARGQKVPLTASLGLVAAAALLVAPAVLIGASEWSNALAPLSFWDKLHNAWFQSVTLRTAGFNSVDLTALRPATLTVMLLCMFIGGGPQSTAGGAKTTTVALLILAVVAAVRGQEHVSAFRRRVSHDTIYKSAAIATLGALSVVGALIAVQLTQDLPFDLALFEVVSALGTVGLTIGATPRLDDVGRLLISACMFMGRVGPMTLFLLLVARRQPRRPALPEEAVAVG